MFYFTLNLIEENFINDFYQFKISIMFDFKWLNHLSFEFKSIANRACYREKQEKMCGKTFSVSWLQKMGAKKNLNSSQNCISFLFEQFSRFCCHKFRFLLVIVRLSFLLILQFLAFFYNLIMLLAMLLSICFRVLLKDKISKF